MNETLNMPFRILPLQQKDIYKWQDASRGHIPAGAVQIGSEANGQPLFIARAKIHGGKHPGKVAQHLGACHVGYAGKEERVSDYKVFTLRHGHFDMAFQWVPVWNGDFMSEIVNRGFRPVKAGKEADGKLLFIAKVRLRFILIHPRSDQLGLNPLYFFFAI
jgi:hypothetical protein